MLQNIFTTSPWVWAGLVAGLFLLPILIHLINMMRHRRVQWAAMEFLLKSHRKHRNWVWLKQLLLLLSRIAAMLLALFTLGQIGCNSDALSRFLGGRTTHHYVLLDDSYSMEDFNGRQTAFDRARDVLALVAARAREQQNQRFTLLRFSRAQAAEANGVRLQNEATADATKQDTTKQDASSESDARLEVIADINGQLVDSQFENLLEEVRGKLQPSQQAIGPGQALKMTADLIESRPEENAWLYVVSDFRSRDWDTQPEVTQELDRLSAATAEIEMIRCARDDSVNLSISKLAPKGSVRVAGVPLLMEVEIGNPSATVVTNVQVDIQTMAFDRSDPQALDFESMAEPLPTVFIEKIEPGETQVRSFPVFFRNPGQHVVQASLEQDAVASDNRRWDVVEIQPNVRVLLVDNETQLNGPGLAITLNPNSLTGIEPDLRQKDFLRDASLDSLLEYDVIYLLDIDRLDESAVRNLEDFARSGGGVCFFVGPFTNLSFYSQSLYREGEGIFPAPLEKAIPIPEQFEDPVPDIAINQHPVFEPLLGMKNSPLNLVQVSEIVRPPLEWNPSAGSTVEIAATIRGESNWPLLLSQSYGQGRVCAIMTTPSPVWNNWARNATFPLTMLVMQDWLAAGKHTHQDRLVGQLPRLQLPADKYQLGGTLLAPSSDPQNRIEHTKTAVATANSGVFAIEGGDNPAESGYQGIYDLWLKTVDNEDDVRRFALNVDPAEGALSWMTSQQLTQQFKDADPKVTRWDQFSSAVQRKRRVIVDEDLADRLDCYIVA